MSFITGVGLTSYGKHEGSSSLDLMSKAAELAIADAGLKRSEIDGILCGYSTVSPHIHAGDRVRRALSAFSHPMRTRCRSAAPPGSP
jgi:3-oxoacyl-[acyl-carrier-protein] synthase III